jgi:hypothetical protein
VVTVDTILAPAISIASSAYRPPAASSPFTGDGPELRNKAK